MELKGKLMQLNLMLMVPKKAFIEVNMALIEATCEAKGTRSGVDGVKMKLK